MFKGAYIRHLSYTLELTSQFPPSAPLPLSTIAAFVFNNSYSVNNYAQCPDSSFGMQWSGPCNGLKDEDTATHTSALDLLIAAMIAADQLQKDTTGTGRAALTAAAEDLVELGVGNCEDSNHNPMPNCYISAISESACRAQTLADKFAVGYDFNIACDATSGVCRVRTLGGAAACPTNWKYTGGAATNISQTTGQSLTICAVKSAQSLAAFI